MGSIEYRIVVRGPYRPWDDDVLQGFEVISSDDERTTIAGWVPDEAFARACVDRMARHGIELVSMQQIRRG